FLKKTNGPAFIHIIALPGNEPVPNIPLSAEEIKENLMKGIRKTENKDLL
ncbi:MAG: thiamine pyrophosphate-binding protein, partial [Nitrospirae bacterium]